MYSRSHDRFNKISFLKRILGSPVASAPIPQGVDIVMTHGPAANHLDLCARDGNRAGCEHLWRALERVKPRLHCCGHIHEGYGVEQVQWDDEKRKAKVHDTRTLSMTRVYDNGTSYDATELITSAAQAGKARSSKSTILVNASILDERYKPTHSPILVRLNL